MDNFLDNGAVLPTGLLSEDDQAALAGFNKSYKNVALRVGVVVESFPVSDSQNRSKLTTEYNVMVIEQHQDRGATPQLYRNCMSAEGLGSVADFFEKTLRKMKKKTTKGTSVNLKGQNGAIVLLLCLDSMSDKGIIIGALTHPDRKTTLADEGPHLEAEFNGIHVVINSDGSITFTFKGATDNDGNQIDASQGNTVVTVEKDGSYQVNHKSITQRFDKGGDASLTADGNISNTTKKDFSVTATGGINLTATKDLTANCDQLTANAKGSATFQSESFTVEAQSMLGLKGAQISVEAQALAKIKAPLITLDGLVFIGGPGGQPLLTLTAQMFGIGNLGLPVISNAISGFTLKTFGV
jgi:hypothetical protein